MQQLFADQSFADIMSARLGQMKAEIEKLKCADVENLNDAQLRGKAEKFAEKYVAADIPRIDRANLEKTESESSGLNWILPFSGTQSYFKYTPSEPQRVPLVDKIEGNRIFIHIEENANLSAADAQMKAESLIDAIERALARVQQDADLHFSAEKLTESAENILRRKRDSCAKLRASGYSVR